jgi:hypothetical protein
MRGRPVIWVARGVTNGMPSFPAEEGGRGWGQRRGDPVRHVTDRVALPNPACPPALQLRACTGSRRRFCERASPRRAGVAPLASVVRAAK